MWRTPGREPALDDQLYVLMKYCVTARPRTDRLLGYNTFFLGLIYLLPQRRTASLISHVVPEWGSFNLPLV